MFEPTALLVSPVSYLTRLLAPGLLAHNFPMGKNRDRARMTVYNVLVTERRQTTLVLENKALQGALDAREHEIEA